MSNVRRNQLKRKNKLFSARSPPHFKQYIYTCLFILLFKPNQFQDSSLSIHTSMSAFNTPRLVLNKFLAKSQREGQGAIVRRGIGRYIHFYIIYTISLLSCFFHSFHIYNILRAELKNFDPFLLLDHFSGTILYSNSCLCFILSLCFFLLFCCVN